MLAALQERRDRRKAALGARRRNVQFAAGDEALLDTDHTPLPSRSCFLLAGRAPSRYSQGPIPRVSPRPARRPTRIASIPATWRISVDEFNVERREAGPGGGTRAGPEGLPAVQQLLKSKIRWGRPYVLVRRAGLEALDSDESGDTREPLRVDSLPDCGAAVRVATCERATGCILPRPTAPPSALAAAAPSLILPAGFAAAAAPPPPHDLGAALAGRSLLHWRPDDGWQRGTVERLCPRAAFSHVVAYMRQASAAARRGAADMCGSSPPRTAPLDAPLPGSCGRGRALRPRDPGAPGLDFRFQWPVSHHSNRRCRGGGADRRAAGGPESRSAGRPGPLKRQLMNTKRLDEPA